MTKRTKEYKRKQEICNCNNLLVKLRESEKFTVKEGIVFDKETGECLGTIHQIYEERMKESEG